MRTFTTIALTAVLATPVAALSIVDVMTGPIAVSELSVEERRGQIAELSVEERNAVHAELSVEERESMHAELSVEERNNQFAELKINDRTKQKKGAAPIFDTVLDTQIG